MASASIIQVLTDKLQTHKEIQFTGIVHIGTGKKAHWSIYFHMGRLVWAHAQVHPVRRWYRQIVKHCAHLLEGFDQNYAELHYSKLVAKVREGNLNRIPMARAVEDYLSEILFDIIHQGTLRDLQSKSGFTLIDTEQRFDSSLFLIMRAEQAWQQALYDWQAWQQAELVKCSPNLAPKIGDAEELKKRTSPAVYEHLTNIIDGKNSFRDLAVHLNQPLLPLTRRIVPYVRQGLMGLVRLEDLGSFTSEQKSSQKNTQSSAASSSEASQLMRSARTSGTLPPNPALTAPTQSASEPNASSFLKRPSSYEKTNAALLGLQARGSSGSKLTKASSSAPLIIYIDDSPMDSRAMSDILQNAGFRFRNIQESTHALPLLIEYKPQLIFLDLVMPVANGYEICAQVRRVSLFKDIPIVIVTSNNSLADRVHAKMVGASGFLSKPIDRDKVLKTVHKLLNIKLSSANKTNKKSTASNLEKARRLRAAGEKATDKKEIERKEPREPTNAEVPSV